MNSVRKRASAKGICADQLCPASNPVSGVEEMLKLLTNEFHGFIFSNKLKCVDTETSLLNDNGLNYISMERYY